MFDYGNANKEQIEAIQSIAGPLLIIAGPGTGKTFTLVKRAVYLLKESNIKPEEMMIVTFTEKAASELISRISDEMINQNLKLNIDEMLIGTFHSICLNILKDNIAKTSFKKNLRVIDSFDQIYLIYQNIVKFDNIEDIDLYVFKSKTSAWNKSKIIQSIINSSFEEMLDVNDLNKSLNQSEVIVSNIMRVYSQLILDENCIDFAHIQFELLELLKNNANLRNDLVQKIKYIMVDEYQDTNYIQEQITFMLLNDNKNLCVVGDDDQGLYRFRGATIRNILEFPEKFEKIKKITLNQNYRSEKKIVDFYNGWMDNKNTVQFGFLWDKYRFKKDIIASKLELFEGESVHKLTSLNNIEELHNKISSFIFKLKNSGAIDDFSQIAFLFRSVKSDKVISLYEHLEQVGIPVYSPRSNLFFAREEIQTFIGLMVIIFPQYLKKLSNKHNDDRREIHEYLLSCVLQANSILNNSESFELKKWVRYRSKDHLFMNKRTDYSFSTLIYQIFQFSPFKDMLDTDLSLEKSSSREVTNLSILIEMVVKYEYLYNSNHFSPEYLDWTLYTFFEQYLRFLMEGGVSEFEDRDNPVMKGAVSFLTIHQSKGLEFPIVFVGSQNAVPRKQKFILNELIGNHFFKRLPYEPENSIKYFDFWRLFYTAYSRAKNQLILFSNIKEGRGKEPSKYFENLYINLCEANKIDSKYDKNRESTVKKTYSFTSDIQTYDNCSLQYKFFKELKFTPVRMGSFMFGTLVHQTIEDIHNEALEGNASRIDEQFIENHFKLNYEAISKKEHMFLGNNVRKSALSQVINYYYARKDEFASLVEVEIPLSYVKDTYIIKGKVDLLKKGENYHIVDFKTGKKPDMEIERDKIDKNMRQLEIYAYLFYKTKHIKVDFIDNYYTSESNSNPVISQRVNNLSVEKTVKRFDKVIKKIQNKEFKTRTENIRDCRNCDFKFYCKKY